MKKIGLVLAIVLLAWNVWLTVNFVQIYSDHSQVTETNTGTTIVTQTVHDYTTDLTTAVKDVQSKLVTVTSVNESRTSSVSGFIYTSNNSGVYIVTSAAIVIDASSVEVKFDNNISFEATVLGYDTVTDCALLHVKPDFDVEAVTLGDSDIVKEGEYVFSLTGRNEMADAGITTFGVISSHAQVTSDTEPNHINDILTSDIALTDMSYGAPLFNISGEVVGMISRRVTPVTTRLTTAISVNELKLVVEEIMNESAVSRAYLGVIARNVSEIQAYEKGSFGLQLDIAEGILITRIEEDSPAMQAGMMLRDVIVSANDEPISSIKDLREFLYRQNSGDSVTFAINRQGAVLTCTVVLQ